MLNILHGAEPCTSDDVLAALGELIAQDGERFELVVVGGAGLLALGLIERSTRDVDVVALRRDEVLVDPAPFAPALLEARRRVAADFGLPEDWLNTAPAILLELGLPEGFCDRLERRDYGPGLTVWLASRVDQIHLKLYALADQAPGSKHDLDLRALAPTRARSSLPLPAGRARTTRRPVSGRS